MKKPHNFSCKYCHISKKIFQKKSKCLEKNIIKNPSDLKYAYEKCGKCHKKDIDNVKKSLMSTNAGIINTTRYLWGFQKSPKAIYSTIKVGFLKRIPDNTIVDDFLRKVCLRCHINTEGSKRYGEKRSSGCAACHIVYKNDGTHYHNFTKNIPVYQCLHCHNFNRVGVDYVGYFEHDYNQVYDSPLGNKNVKKIYGVLQHRLNPDIHFKKGMKCIDCHTKNEIMGDGKIYSFKYQQVKIRCENCHGNPHKNDKNHKNLECYACHSLWGAQDYGMNVIREDYQGYIRWKDFKDINIPDTQRILHKALGIYGDPSKLSDNLTNVRIKFVPPKMTDYIDNKKKLGVWYILWTFRRWEDPVLGIDYQGKISPVRPDYQFYVTWIDKNMNVKIDDKKMIFNWNPYVPHTITLRGRDCYSCHFNLKALGLGYGMRLENGKIINMFINPIEKIVNIKGKFLQKFIYPNSSPLTYDILKKLLK